MAVDVVIVTFQSEATLGPCVEAVRRWPDCGRVVVVDNDSTDGSVAVARRVADEVVEHPANLGFGTAQNRGVAAVATPFVLLLNPDAVVDPEGLARGIEALEGEPAVAMVEGRIVRSRDGVEERWAGARPGLRDLVARLLRLRERLGEERLRRLARRVGSADYADRTSASDRDVEFLAAVAPLVRVEAFRSVGGFDERIFLYGEDVDLCARLAASGWRLRALATPWARHVGGASSADRQATRERLWWTSHAQVVRSGWHGPRRIAGLAITGVGAARARRRDRW